MIVTALPFRRQGNQSLLRFTKMLIHNGCFVKLLSSERDADGEVIFNSQRFFLKRFKAPFKSFYHCIKSMLTLKKVKSLNFVEGDKFISYANNFFPAYGKHCFKRYALSKILFLVMLLDNLYLFFLLLFLSYGYKNIVCYEYNYTIAGQLLKIFLRKKLITKYQGTCLYSAGRSISDCKKYYASTYYGLVQGNLCIMVDDGTEGDYYAAQKKFRNLLFISHGVESKLDKNSLNADLKKLISESRDKIIISNISSGHFHKRPDRFIAAILSLEKKYQDKIMCICATKGAFVPYLFQAVNSSKINCLNILTDLNSNDCLYLVKNSSLVVAASDYSNLSNYVLESIYNHVPVLSIKKLGLDKLINNKNNGILVDQVDVVQNFSNEIKKIVQKPSLLQEIKMNIQGEVKSLAHQQNIEWARIENEFF